MNPDNKYSQAVYDHLERLRQAGKSGDKEAFQRIFFDGVVNAIAWYRRRPEPWAQAAVDELHKLVAAAYATSSEFKKERLAWLLSCVAFPEWAPRPVELHSACYGSPTILSGCGRYSYEADS